jgi:hypothetical protein
LRRTRFGGARTDGAEAPLNEENERCEVDILNGRNVVLAIAMTQPSANYPAAWQIADFGAAQASVSLRVYQLSAAVGRGWPGAAII